MPPTINRPMVFTRSTPLHDVPSPHIRSTLTFTNTSQRNSTSQSTSNGYHSGHNSNGFHGARGGRGSYGGSYGGGRYEGDMSAARQLHQQISQSHGHSQRYRGGSVGVFPASAASAASTSQQRQPADKQEIAEPATIVWCEGGIGEVMSPSVWRHPNLHVYFDASKTQLEGKDGWSGLREELEAGMEMDVTFTMSQRLLQQLDAQQYDTEGGAETHTFVCIAKIAELRASKCSSMRTYEQAVVIAKRASGAAFLINNLGERTVLHPNFLLIDGVRHAILEKATGQKRIPTSEVDDSPSSLCVLGRSLAVRLAPAPCWLPTIYDTDRGVSRWALSAEPYGEEKQGRAVVVKASRHSIVLCAVEGDLAGKRTSLHAPIIQMTGEIKMEVQEVGSSWRFRACRELPGRSAVWRAFEITRELDTDVPISEAVLDSILTGNRLIELDPEEEHFVDPLLELNREREEREERRADRREEEEERKESTMLDDLAQLQLVFSPPPTPAPVQEAASASSSHDLIDEDDNNVLVYEPIDDMLDSTTFALDVFKAPPVLPNEWMLLGVPLEEAVKTERELQLAAFDLPLVAPMERQWGVYTTGDERPDMRVHPKKRAKKKRRRLESISSEEEEGDREEEENPAATTDSPPDAVVCSPMSSHGSSDKENSAAERKREKKEDARLRNHFASMEVAFASTGDDLFDMLHADEPVEGALTAAPTPAATRDPKPTAVRPAAPVATAAAAPTTISFATAGDDLFDLLQGGSEPATVVAAVDSRSQPEKGRPAAPVTTTAATATPSPVSFATSADDLSDLLHGDAKPPAAAAAIAASTSRQTSSYVGRVMLGDDAHASTPAMKPAARAATKDWHSSATLESTTVWKKSDGPRFDILPYPEQPRHADGWWYRRTRPLPLPVESSKEKRKRKKEAEERWKMAQQESQAAGPSQATDAHLVYKDDLRERLLGGLKKREEKHVEPLVVVTASVEREEERTEEQNVLVDLSPTTVDGHESPTAAADPAPSLQSPTELHDDLKDLF